jgi:hypothetical protein
MDEIWKAEKEGKRRARNNTEHAEGAPTRSGQAPFIEKKGRVAAFV